MRNMKIGRCCLAGLFLWIVQGATAQINYGTTGLMNLPTADMQRDKTFMAGGNWLNHHATVPRWWYDTWNYYINITIFPWLEAGYLCTGHKAVPTDYGNNSGYWVPSTYGKFTNQDRSFHFRLRVWKEGWWKPWTPQVVIGANDAIGDSANGGSLSNQQNQDYGNGFWNRYYLAITKHVNFDNIGTLGAHISWIYSNRFDNKLNNPAMGVNFCFHLMLGKASPKMLEVYRFLAENTQRIAQLKRAPVYSDDDCTSWWITDGLRIWDATPKEKEKIPAVVLTASLIRNPDERLQALADELNERYGGSWLMPVFMKAIITQPKEQVYETYSPLLDTPQKGYLFHALGMLHYRCYPEGWTYERLGPDGMIALIFWGDYSYGTYDTRFMIERYVDLDERWLFDLAKDPEGRKPTVTWQIYNRGGVLYGSYDEMFISLLPLKVENPELKRVLWDYFRIRSQKKKVAKSITVYKDAAGRFGDE